MWGQKTLATREKNMWGQKTLATRKKHVGSENPGNQEKTNLCGQKSLASTVAKVNTGHFKMLELRRADVVDTEYDFQVHFRNKNTFPGHFPRKN